MKSNFHLKTVQPRMKAGLNVQSSFFFKPVLSSSFSKQNCSLNGFLCETREVLWTFYRLLLLVFSLVFILFYYSHYYLSQYYARADSGLEPGWWKMEGRWIEKEMEQNPKLTLVEVPTPDIPSLLDSVQGQLFCACVVCECMSCKWVWLCEK